MFSFKFLLVKKHLNIINGLIDKGPFWSTKVQFGPIQFIHSISVQFIPIRSILIVKSISK